LTDLC
jgi:hypothetical protein